MLEDGILLRATPDSAIVPKGGVPVPPSTQKHFGEAWPSVTITRDPLRAFLCLGTSEGFRSAVLYKCPV